MKIQITEQPSAAHGLISCTEINQKLETVYKPIN